MLPLSQAELNESQSQKLPDTCPIGEKEECSQTWDSHNNNKPPWGLLYPLNSKFRTLEMIKNLYTVGRSPKNDLVFSKELEDSVLGVISKEHFKLRREYLSRKGDNDEYVVYLDDCSFNGTFINGRKVGRGNSTVLVNNDEISVAFAHFRMFIYITASLDPEVKSYPEKVREKYAVSRKLGAGACGEVKLCFEKVTGKPYAMKIIQKRKFQRVGRPQNLNDPINILREINILKSLNHSMIIKFKDVFDYTEVVFIIMEYVEGGELFDRLQGHVMKEAEVKVIFYQLALAVKYLHNKGIIHRDVKPENILLASDGPHTLIKLADFGLSNFVDSQSYLKTLCGTPMYIAPEVLKMRGRDGSYGRQADIWSMGVVLYVCLCGLTPFSSLHPTMTLQEQILKGDYSFPSGQWKGVSREAKHLVKRLLTVDPRRRINLDDVLKHPWLNDKEMKLQLGKLLTWEQRLTPRKTDEESGEESEGEARAAKRQKLEDTDTRSGSKTPPH